MPNKDNDLNRRGFAKRLVGVVELLVVLSSLFMRVVQRVRAVISIYEIVSTRGRMTS